MAMLLLSVAPEVNTISLRVGADQRGDLRRAPLRRRPRRRWPMACSTLCGLPKRSVNKGSIASSTRGSQRRGGLVVEIDRPVRSGGA